MITRKAASEATLLFIGVRSMLEKYVSPSGVDVVATF